MRVLILHQRELDDLRESVDTASRRILDRASELGRTQQNLLKELSLPEPVTEACEIPYCGLCLRAEQNCRCERDASDYRSLTGREEWQG